MNDTTIDTRLATHEQAALTQHTEPAWLDKELYPFAPHTMPLPAGRMHYVDEGRGTPVVMVHGTPTWSFLYRRLVTDLRDTHRCIAPDHLGFGLSEKPREFGYTPADHAANLATLIDRLQLRDITLVVHDFGGPIGLRYAIDHPENVARIVVLNSWMWSHEGNTDAKRLSSFVAGPIGRVLYRYLNFAPRVVLPMAFADRRNLTPAMRRHYQLPFASRHDRTGPWVLGRELYGSNAFYGALWDARDRLRNTPMQIVWGARDIAFKDADLARWRGAFPDAAVEIAPDAGHFVQEEAPQVLTDTVRRFLGA